MGKLRLGIAVALTAVACATATDIYKLNLRPYQLEGADFPLPSGLRVFFQEDKERPSVLVASTIGVGSAGDPMGKEGIAHLVEHLCFRARHGKNPKVMDQIKILGGVFDAYTSNDNTTYYTVAPRGSLLALLEIEAQRMLNPLEGVTQQVLDVEREVVRNEMRYRTETTVGSKVYDQLAQMLYPPGHAYHRSGIGSHGSLDSITVQDLQDFVKKHYRPEHTTIVVTGDFDRKDAGRLLAQAFPRTLLAAPGQEDKQLPLAEPQARVKGPSAEPPLPHDKKIRFIEGPLTNTTVILAWSLPGGYRDNEWLMNLTVATMEPAVGSLLFPRDLYDEDQITGIHCGVAPGVVSSMAICSMELARGEDPEQIIKKAIDGLWEHWDQATRFSRNRRLGVAKTNIMAETLHRSTSFMRAVSISPYLHFTNHPDFFSRTISGMSGVKEANTRDFAFEYLNRKRVVALVVEPYGIDEKPSPVVFDQDALYSGSVLEESQERNDFFAKLDNKKIEAVAVAPDLTTMRTFVLPNKLKVVLKKHGQAPFLQAQLLFGGGFYSTRPVGLLDFATVAHDAKDPLMVAGHWQSDHGGEAHALGVETPSGNLPAALDLLATRVQTERSRYEEIYYKKALENARRGQRDLRDSPSYWLNRAVLGILLPGHPMAAVDYDIDALAKLDRGAFDHWIQRINAPANATLLVVGDLDLDRAQQEVTQRFAGWRRKSPGKPVQMLPKMPPPPQQQIVLVDRQQGSQSEVVVACHTRPQTIDNQMTRVVTAGLLQEDLWRAIRERAGASYGVGVSQDLSRGGVSLLMIKSTIENAKVVASVRTMLDKLQELSSGRVDRVRLNETKWNLARRSHTSGLGIQDMLNSLNAHLASGFTVEQLETMPKRLAAVSEADVADFLQPCAGHAVVIIVGPAEAFKEQAASLGAPVKELDWNGRNEAQGAGSTP